MTRIYCRSRKKSETNPSRPRPRPRPKVGRPRPRPRPKVGRPRPRPRPQKFGLESSRDRDRGLENYIPGHAFVYKKAPSRIARHQQLNDIVYRALVAAGVPASKEPVGLCRSDGKRPDGMSLIPWKSGKLLLWDVTVASTLADS